MIAISMKKGAIDPWDIWSILKEIANIYRACFVFAITLIFSSLCDHDCNHIWLQPLT